jgi:hypothetical protein
MFKTSNRRNPLTAHWAKVQLCLVRVSGVILLFCVVLYIATAVRKSGGLETERQPATSVSVRTYMFSAVG